MTKLSPISILLSVALIAMVLFVLTPMAASAFKTMGEVITIETSAELKDTSSLIETCSEFYQDLFREDLYDSIYKSKFSTSIPHYTYKKTRAFCGAALEIVNAGNSGKDVNATVQEINEDYRKIYPGFWLDDEAISENIRTSQNQVWLEGVVNDVKVEVESVVNDIEVEWSVEK